MKATHGDLYAIGAFVEVKSESARKFGIGKIADRRGNQATVTYFDVPSDNTPFELDAHVSDLVPSTLPEQTRVFRQDDSSGRWQVGRIVNGEGPTCLVAFPNKQIANVPREQLYVRWRKPIARPIEFLARQVAETPRFAQARSRFMRAVTRQRAASRGMSALLSSAVQLVSYQFNVVQCVLQDPIQRYLLADEVGLGKTVEAGMLVRQFLLDSVDACALLIVPAPLVQQWRQELIQRFGLFDALDDFLFVVASDKRDQIQQLLPRAGMLVVDEAHHLSRQGDTATNWLYELLQVHAPRMSRLLLLSATPVLSDTQGFLRMLHLLDPVVFPLNDLAGFERRIQARQVVAEVAASLCPENMLSMEDDLDRLQETFHDDPTLLRRIDTLRPIVQNLPAEDDESFLSALNELHAHLTESYKLHRRILRNRRKKVDWATSGRSGLRVVEYNCSWRGERHQVLDELRVHLLNADLIRPIAHALFTVAMHPVGGSSVNALLRAAGIDDSRAIELAQRIDELTHRSIGEAHRENALLAAVRDCLRSTASQVVVFCDQGLIADRLTEFLQKGLDRETEVLRHVLPGEDEDDDAVSAPWTRFLSDTARCRVLVCDAHAEEGLNLHGGSKVAFHFDLPAAPNRIEQRLGRLDRFGSTASIVSMSPVCLDDPTEQAWLACLSEGLEVFDESMASLQYLVEETLHAEVTDWCYEGVEGIARWSKQLAGPTGWVARERRRIDQQDALDAMGEPDSDDFSELEDIDGDWREWKEAFNGFALTTLQFRARSEEWSGDLRVDEQVFRLGYARDNGHQTLLPLTDFVTKFLGTVDTASRHSTARSPLTYPYAFARGTVMTKEGRMRGLRALRYGDSLVESLKSFCQSDDRGRAFAVWRHRPSFEARDASGIDLWFRFDFLIEANLRAPNDDEARAMWRRADQHFPPQFYTVWVDAGGSISMDAPAVVKEDYLPDEVNAGVGRDFNLNPIRWQILELLDSMPWTAEWRRHCEQAAEQALSFVVAQAAVVEHTKRGLASLQRQHEVRAAQFEARSARLEGAARDAELCELEAERSMHATLADAIRSPLVRNDVAGALFLSATTPFER